PWTRVDFWFVDDQRLGRKEPNMVIIGVDYHPSDQYIAFNDAQLLLKLLLENTFPRVWVPSPENRDLRQLLWHRHRLVQMRTRIMNQLQALAMNEGQRR